MLLYCLARALMQSPAAFEQQRVVGDLLRERMLEGVFELREEARLVQELRGLEIGEIAVQLVSGRSAMAVSRVPGTSVPMTAAVCSRRLASGGSRSMRAASTACTVAGTWILCSGCARR